MTLDIEKSHFGTFLANCYSSYSHKFCIDKTQWFPLNMLMFGQESCFFGHSIFEIPLWPKRRCYFRMNLNPLRKVKAQACSHGLMTSLFRLDLTAWYPTPAWNNGPKADFQFRFFLVFIPCVLCLQSSVAFYFFCVNKWDSQMTYRLLELCIFLNNSKWNWVVSIYEVSIIPLLTTFFSAYTYFFPYSKNIFFV